MDSEVSSPVAAAEWNWRRLLLIGAAYPIVGVAIGELAGSAASDRARFLWRLSAFALSGLVFAAHFAFEHFRARGTVRHTALATSGAVAFGAFGLALVANLHDLTSASGYRPRMLVALVAWPLITAVPLFVLALVAAAILRGKRA